MISLCAYAIRIRGHVRYSTQSEQIIKVEDKQINNVKLNWLVYNMGDIEHSSSDHAHVA